MSSPTHKRVCRPSVLCASPPFFSQSSTYKKIFQPIFPIQSTKAIDKRFRQPLLVRPRLTDRFLIADALRARANFLRGVRTKGRFRYARFIRSSAFGNLLQKIILVTSLFLYTCTRPLHMRYTILFPIQMLLSSGAQIATRSCTNREGGGRGGEGGKTDANGGRAAAKGARLGML